MVAESADETAAKSVVEKADRSVAERVALLVGQ